MTKFETLVALTDKPVIVADEHSIIVEINSSFTEVLGWTGGDLLGQSLTKILPEKFIDAHNLGFSRFLATEETSIVEQEIDLEVLTRNGETIIATHFITAAKKNGKWFFAATIVPRK